MKVEDYASLIGKYAVYNGKTRKIGGIHIYISEGGVKSVKIHFVGLPRYVKFIDIEVKK